MYEFLPPNKPVNIYDLLYNVFMGKCFAVLLLLLHFFINKMLLSIFKILTAINIVSLYFLDLYEILKF